VCRSAACKTFVPGHRKWCPIRTRLVIGLEYFCFEHDGLWDISDADLIELAKKELLQIGLAREGDVIDGCVVRQKKAYPVYDDDYAQHVAIVREEIEERYRTCTSSAATACTSITIKTTP
jgi:protoporphyrinogen oxidase